MSGSVLQSGPVTPGHVATWTKNGGVADGGAAGKGIISEVGITNPGGLAIAINSGAITGPYSQLGFSVGTDGVATISVKTFNGGPPAGLTVSINGINYPFPGPGTGNVIGPGTAVSGDIVAFNGPSGTVIQDGSVAVSSVMPTVATIAALRAATTTTLVNHQCFVLGYYGAADGGEGPFWLNPADTTSADNSGTIIVDASGRRWHRLCSETQYSVKWFGAKGNGVTDDLAAINATIAALAGTGGVVYFPPGIYGVSNTILIRTPDITLQGSGAGNWLFDFRPNKATTILYIGTRNTGALLQITPVVPTGDFIWCVNVRDITFDCNNGGIDIGILPQSICNSEFANLNIFNAGTAALYMSTAATTAPAFCLRNNFRNINISVQGAAHGMCFDGVIGANSGGGGAFNHCENVQVTFLNGTAYLLISCDDNVFFNCGASRGPGGTGTGLLLSGSNSPVLKRAQNNAFYWFICAGTPVGTAAPIHAVGGSFYPSANNYIQFSSMDGNPAVIVDPYATLYYYTSGSYISGCQPVTEQPGIRAQDFYDTSNTSQLLGLTKLWVLGRNNNGNPLIQVFGGTPVGGGASASLPMFDIPMQLQDVAFSQLPLMGATNSGCMVYCFDGRKPGEGAGAGTGVPVFYAGNPYNGWISCCSGAPVTH